MAWDQEPMEALGLTSRLNDVLRAAGVETLGRLLQMKRLDLYNIPHLGPNAVLGIIKKQQVFLQDPERALQRWQEKAAAAAAKLAPRPITADAPLDVLKIPTRPMSALRVAKIKTVGQLCGLTRAQLRGFGGFGPHSLGQLEQALLQHGLALAEGPEEAPALPSPKRTREPGSAPANGRRPSRHYRGSFPGTRIGPFPADLAGRSIEVLALSRRTYNALTAHGIRTLGDLSDRALGSLLALRNLGRSSAREVLNATASLLRRSEDRLSPDALAPVPDCLDDLRLTGRARLAIDLTGTTTIAQLCALRPQDLTAHTGVGMGTVAEIERVLARHGLALAAKGPRGARPVPPAVRLLDSLEEYAGACRELLAAGGGAMSLDELAAALAARYPTERYTPLGFARLILPRCKGIRSAGDLWMLKSRWERFRQVGAQVRQELTAAGHPLLVQTLIARIGPADGAMVWAHLQRNKRLQVAGAWCLLTAWLPRAKVVWAVAALDFLGRPAGAGEVARVLGKIAPHLGTVNLRQALRRASEVEEVGPWVFGLRRWGAEARAAAAQGDEA